MLANELALRIIACRHGSKAWKFMNVKELDKEDNAVYKLKLTFMLSLYQENFVFLKLF
jgi:hypothetical protein